MSVPTLCDVCKGDYLLKRGTNIRHMAYVRTLVAYPRLLARNARTAKDTVNANTPPGANSALFEVSHAGLAADRRY